MTQSEEVILQVDNKDKEGMVHGFWMVQSIKDVLDRGKESHQKVTRERSSRGGPGTP